MLYSEIYRFEKFACDYFEIKSFFDLNSSRKIESVKMKWIIVFYLRIDAKLSLKEIAKIMFYSNHTSILHLINNETFFIKYEDSYLTFKKYINEKKN
jgi:chromosomal replication initiation ATPase DnaA